MPDTKYTPNLQPTMPTDDIQNLASLLMKNRQVSSQNALKEELANLNAQSRENVANTRVAGAESLAGKKNDMAKQNIADLINPETPAGKAVATGRAVKVGGTSMGAAPNPNAGAGVVTKDDAHIASENQKVTSAFEKDAGESLKSIRQMDIVKALRDKNTMMTIGPERIAQAKAVVGQRLAASEIPMASPMTVRAEVVNKLNQWIPGKTADPVLSPEEMNALDEANQAILAPHKAHVNAVYQRTMKNLKNLAPTTHRLGRQKELIDSLTDYKNSSTGETPPEQGAAAPQPQGLQQVGIGTQQPAPKQPMSFEEFKAAKAAGKL